MGTRVTDTQVQRWREELRQGYTLDAVASRNRVSAKTVRRHAGFNVAGRLLLLDTEVHLIGLRGRWVFQGEIGYSSGGEQYARFVSVRTGRSRILHTKLIAVVHRGAGGGGRQCHA